MAATILFYAFALFILVSAVLMVLARNIFHSALYLAAVLFGVAGIYVLLNAHFLAAVQILVYIGAVVVLSIFVINLTKEITGEKAVFATNQIPVAVLSGLLAFTFIVLAVLKSNLGIQAPALSDPNDTAKIGKLLLGDYVLPFEVVSVLLLAAMIAAIAIVTRDKEEEA